jgi:diacylglycerol kinase (ATP)
VIRRVAVVAHTGKTLGGGLDELRLLLTARGIDSLDWYEVPKSRKAPKKVRKALKHKPDLLVVWGGDGMVQRCTDAAVGHKVPIAVIPAGTANLLARNLDIPIDLPGAVDVAFDGAHRSIDLGRFNGEHFVVMAGLGFDADMIEGADGSLKRRLGRLAYVWTGARAVSADPVNVTVKLDGVKWFHDEATCVLVGNVSHAFGAIELFDGAEPDDGFLDVGVTTASNPAEWARALASIGTGPSTQAPYVRIGRARTISVSLRGKLRYEVDGGAREKIGRAKIQVVPGAVTVCVPEP